MNKQKLNELIKQADTYAYKMNPEQDSYGRSANPKKFQQDRDAKFAELIVKQAGAYLMSPEFIGRSDLDWSMVLNEHFGLTK